MPPPRKKSKSSPAKASTTTAASAALAVTSMLEADPTTEQYSTPQRGQSTAIVDSQSATPSSQGTTVSKFSQNDTQDSSPPLTDTNLKSANGKGKKRAAVHEHIEEKEIEGGTEYICLKCKRQGKHKSWQWNHTGAFRKHMKKHEYDNLRDHLGQLNDNANNNGNAEEEGPDWEAFDEAQTNNAKEITVALCNMIVACPSSFSLVKNRFFKRLVSLLNSDYTLPGQKAIRQKLHKQCQMEKSTMAEYLDKCIDKNNVSLTTDVCAGPNGRSFLATTLHFMDDNCAMRSVLVSFSILTDRHTGERLAHEVVEGLYKMNPRLLCSVWACTSDKTDNKDEMIKTLNGGVLCNAINAHLNNNKSGKSDSTSNNSDTADAINNEVEHILCMAHILNQCIEAGLGKVTKFDISLNRLRKLLEAIGESDSISQLFNDICVEKGVCVIELELDVPTQWKQTWDMIDKAIILKAALDEITQRFATANGKYNNFHFESTHPLCSQLTDDEWTTLKQFRHILKPFKAATDMLSGSRYPTIGMVILTFHRLQQSLAKVVDWSKSNNKTDLHNFAKAVLDKLVEYKPESTTDTHKVASALDPRALSHMSAFGYDNACLQKLITDRWEKQYKRRWIAAEEERVRSCASTANNDDSDDEGLYHDSGVASDLNPQSSSSFQCELQGWFASPRLALNAEGKDVLNWLERQSHFFLRLSLMARDYLAIPATSVPSKCAFSRAGVAFGTNRRKLEDNTVEETCELQSFLSFKY
jgi:hAT family C-terminal dimerisation region